MRTTFLFVFSVFFSLFSFGQKPSLHHDVYNDWKQINATTLSKTGEWLAVQQDPQEGDGNLVLYRENEKTAQFARAYEATFTPDEKQLLFLVKPTLEETKAAKRKGKKKDELPKSHLVLYQLESGKMDTVFNVTAFSVPEQAGNWCAVKLANEKKAKKDTTASTEKTADFWDATGGKKKADDDKGIVLLLRKLADTTSIRIENVLEYTWADSATVIFYATAKKDTTFPAAVWTLPFNDQKANLLDSGMTHYTNLVASPNGRFFTFMGTNDSDKAEIKTYDWFFFANGKRRWKRSGNWNDSLIISKDYKPVFTEDNSMLFFGVATKPFPTTKDSMLLDEEKVNLDLWSWNDPYIQPMQLKNKDSDSKKSYRMVFWTKENKYVSLTNAALPEVSFSKKFPTEWLAGYNSDNYKIQATWEYPTPRDLFLVNSFTGKKRLIKRGVKGYGSISSGGNFMYWYDQESKAWMLYDIETKKTINASEGVPYPIFDEDWDMPAPPRAYGSAGFTENDSLFVFYDRYDLWGFHVHTNTINCLTNENGRKQKIQLRYQNVNSESNVIEWPSGVVLKGFNETTKGHSLFLARDAELQVLLAGPFQIQQIEKAKKGNVFIHRRGDFSNYPEVYRATNTFSEGTQLTFTNPQQSMFNWATVELVSWTAYDGTPLEGLLYKPEDFNPEKKYPLMIYFYETYSENLHRHYTPQPSWSIINIPYYASNGYVVFVPDIKYTTGNPGGSAFNCIVSGVDQLEKEPWIDNQRMAIQGQSWGGYQVAWLVTQTDKFAAAMAGAPVSNMTSAYGGIRWGSGMARAFQYEQSQSRLGTTMWTDRDAYINNSPLFFADRVTTPLLMMHNDQDEAVPWYQGIEYFVALRRFQKPVWLLNYNGEAHNLKKRHNRKDLTVRMQQFFDYYLKDAPQPLWMKEGIPAMEKGKKYGLELTE